MSAEAVGWVFRHSPLQGVALVVHLAVADSVNDQHDHELWMRQHVLARKARTTRGTVNKVLARMVEGTDDHPPLLELVAPGTGGANRYRFLFPDVEVQYETRTTRSGGARTAHTPPAEGARSEHTGCVQSAQGGARTARTEPKREPKENPTTPTEQRKLLAHTITTEVYRDRNPRPANPFPAVLGVASKLLTAGWSEERVRAALMEAPTISVGWCEAWLNRQRPTPGGRPPTADRGAPAGRVR